MGSILNPTIDYLLRSRRQKSKHGHNESVRRTIIPIDKQIDIKIDQNRAVQTGSSFVRKTPISFDRNLINLKAKLYLLSRKSRLGSPIIRDNNRHVEISEKGGLVNASSTLGRAVQGVGSFVTPGNISPLRSPIRSGIYRALTPGGGGGLRRILPGARNNIARCPAGFEFGGRFADNEFSNCGAQLFEIPGPLALIARGLRRMNNAPDARAESLSEVIEGQPSANRTVQIQRMARIPRNASPNQKAFTKSIQDSIKVLRGAPAGEGRMIRRDGVILRPLVPSSVLRQFSGNPDMLDGAMIRAAQTPSDISSDDLALLAGASMRRVSFIAPNGASISIERARPLTVGERRKFGRQLNSAVASDQNDVGSNIRKFAEGSKGAFKYTEEYGNIPEPLELVTYTGADGVERTVRRWIYETFIKGNLPKGKKK